MASLSNAGADTVGVSDLADAGMALPADLAGMVIVGVADLADAGTAFPADLAGVVAADVATLAAAGVVTINMTSLADAGADVHCRCV